MPFISPRRNESLVLFTQQLDVSGTLAFLAERNAAQPDSPPMTLFHLIACALTRLLDQRPRLNRFVSGGRLWQRDGIWITFSSKKQFSDKGDLSTGKRRLDPEASLEELVAALIGGIRESKDTKKSTSDREVDLLLRLPPPIVRGLMWLLHQADALGLVPRAMIDTDPMFTSVFIANLGSVGLDAGYHHLWEHGTCPIFCMIGRIQEEAGAQTVTLKWTYDERTEDGLYCASSLEILRELVENPAKFS
jgi:hypothetical protein